MEPKQLHAQKNTRIMSKYFNSLPTSPSSTVFLKFPIVARTRGRSAESSPLLWILNRPLKRLLAVWTAYEHCFTHSLNLYVFLTSTWTKIFWFWTWLVRPSRCYWLLDYERVWLSLRAEWQGSVGFVDNETLQRPQRIVDKDRELSQRISCKKKKKDSVLDYILSCI